jgi:hypothetical protein
VDTIITKIVMDEVDEAEVVDEFYQDSNEQVHHEHN